MKKWQTTGLLEQIQTKKKARHSDVHLLFHTQQAETKLDLRQAWTTWLRPDVKGDQGREGEKRQKESRISPSIFLKYALSFSI